MAVEVSAVAAVLAEAASAVEGIVAVAAAIVLAETYRLLSSSLF